MDCIPGAERISKPWVLTALFGYFLPLLAESTTPGAKQEVRREGMRMPLLRCPKFLRCLTADA